MAEVIEKSVEELAPLCREKGIALDMELPERIPETLGDRESLLRVFANLIGNAVKYTPKNGRITVSARSDNYYLTVQVCDTGAGIPPDKLPFIFEPFYRVRGREEQQPGSGLGLTFCKKIMELHGGRITALSKEGQGSTFLLKFIVHRPTDAAFAGPSSGPAAPFRPL
jgi:signal transduction histidine kinase